MKTQITAEQFKATMLPSVTEAKVFNPYVSKPYPTRKQCESKVEALKASIERAKLSC